MKSPTFKALLALTLLFRTEQLPAQNYSVNWFKVAGGGGTSTNATYSISGTLGQQDAGGPMVGGGYSVEGGFWSLYAVQTQATPIITWINPVPITYGMALGSAQLNATANVPGSFAFNPTSGTVPNAGANTLSVIFTPTDAVDYTSATNTVSLAVSPSPLTVTAANASRLYGQANPVFTGTITGLQNGDNITATYSCSANANSSVGTYPIVPSLVDPNNRETDYTTSLVNGTLNVNLAVPVLSVLHTFGGYPNDGAVPSSGLILSGNTLYGTSREGGSSQNGTVFMIDTDGTGFTNLHSFVSSDGVFPDGGLIISGNTLYGTTALSGSSGSGTVFAVNTDGTGFTNLHGFTATSGNPSFINSGGAIPEAGLVLSGNTLYGTTTRGGSSGWGTVFGVNTDGTGFTNLYNFTNGSDGAFPYAGLILSGNTLYGTAVDGGRSGVGTVFRVNTDGTDFTTVYSFTGGSDGGYPYAGLIISGNTLYGTTALSGSSGSGTVFAVNTDGTGFTNLHGFTATSGNPSINSDGAEPYGGLILSGNTLYGTTEIGGTSGSGTVFALNTDGSGFTALYSFTATSGSSPYSNSDGAYPNGGLILLGNNLYGSAGLGGSLGDGTVFSLLLLAPNLAIKLSGANIILTWTNISPGFALQSSANLPPAVWNNVFPPPALVNGQNTVTNPISSTEQFYQLSLPATPSGMALIPTGLFTMGDSLDGESDAIPTVTVNVSAFFMDTNLVSYNQWQSVYNLAVSQGYGFDHAGVGKAANQPVQTVNWYDCVKWCNARSRQAGLTPVYYTDAGLTQVYINGDVTPYVNWAANGYRLPTEAEWEKAARGGLSGQRFPGGDTISESQANYLGCTSGCGFTYDFGPNGYNVIGSIGGTSPATSPVGSFAANGYGLYDMAGNLFEWCWDWHAGTPYPTGSPYLGGSDPRGPASSPNGYRVLRGNDWDSLAIYARCAYRDSNYPGFADYGSGFRCVRGY